jgi:hypothetical protein
MPFQAFQRLRPPDRALFFLRGNARSPDFTGLTEAHCRRAHASVSKCLFVCQIADYAHGSDQLWHCGPVRQFDFYGQDFYGQEASAKCAESNAGLPDLYPFVFEFYVNMVARRWEARAMSAQLRPIGTIAFASALLASGLGVGLPANIAFAVDCLTAPNSPAPPNGHWYYRTDRTQQRQCWHLQTDNGQSEQGAVQTAREAPAKPPQSVAKLSDQDVEKLYSEFLEWKRHAKN